MPNTPNLDLTPLQAAQSSKEITVNQALTDIDNFSGFISIGIVNGSQTLTESQCKAGLIVLTGALTTAATVIIPTPLLKITWVINMSTGGQAVTVQNSGFGGVVCCYNVLTPIWTGAAANAGTRAGVSRLPKSVAGGSNVTLTDAEASNKILEFTGLLTGNINVTINPIVQDFIIYNNTTGAFTITFKTTSGTGIIVAQTKRAPLYCDGTNVVRYGADV